MNEDFSWAEEKEKQVRSILIMGGVDTEDEDEDPLDLMYEDTSDYE